MPGLNGKSVWKHYLEHLGVIITLLEIKLNLILQVHTYLLASGTIEDIITSPLIEFRRQCKNVILSKTSMVCLKGDSEIRYIFEILL
jgi:hypothetical protein